MQGAMNAAQIKQAQDICNGVVFKNEPVFTKVCELPRAKAIQGLRAVFEEVCFNRTSL